MEAMAAGVPVVATGVGGTKELITDGVNGFLAPPGDAEALARQISFALSNDELRRRACANGKRFIEAQFGMSRMVHSVQDLYETVLM
jgi:glycosyltransferase involved in cell wall biosynthesis